MRHKSIPRLQVITDETLQTTHTHQELAKLALEGGADAIQYREKRLKTTREHVDCAKQMQHLCDRHESLLVVNDRVDVACTIDNVAVHLGEDDLPVEVARRLIGDEPIIGCTANSLEQAVSVSTEIVDYLGVGPVFGTQSKVKRAPDLGLANLQMICENVELPVIAIGNIQPEDVSEVIAAGAWGIAVLSGIVCQPDVKFSTRKYVQALNAVLTS